MDGLSGRYLYTAYKEAAAATGGGKGRRGSGCPMGFVAGEDGVANPHTRWGGAS